MTSPSTPSGIPDDRIRPAAPLLAISGLTVRFGGVVALDRVSFDVAAGEICGLIGPNGAGKTTLFNCLSRLYGFDAGSIVFAGRALARYPIHRMAALGIGRTFQNLALFRTLSVNENIMIGGHCLTRGGFFANAVGLPLVRREERRLAARVAELAQFVGLGAYGDRIAADLPFGYQKRVELARALAAEPKLLLLDEPAAGLNAVESEQLGDFLRALRAEGLTLLLVEHDMDLIMRVCDHIVVLNFGRKIAEGPPDAVRQDQRVIDAYLGEEESG
jgi:branched-chain amino acid transport system ATP-binding protein